MEELLMRGRFPSGRDLRRERLVGNWGGASEHIGRRWEELGLDLLLKRIASGEPWPDEYHHPRQVLALSGDDALQMALSRAGLPNPDVIVVLEGDGSQLALQALDFKWNLEFASYGQIRAEAIEGLLQRGVAPLKALLASAVGDHPERLPVLDGLLYSPTLPVNEWFLHSAENSQQEYPIEPREVIFEEVDPRLFFELLPGWEMAVLLARLDRSEGKLQTLEGAEHYYRIGTGLQGAVSQLLVSVFVRQPPTIAANAALDWLRSRARPPASTTFIQHAERQMAARGLLSGRLRNLARSPYRFADLAEALKARGIQLPERESAMPPREREKWGDLLRRVAAEHREVIYRTGLRLVQASLTDAEALTRLEADSRRYAERARTQAEKLIEIALQGA
jgi:hypothetical protein